MKRAQPEQILHEMCVVWLRAQHPKLLFWHTPNESRATPAWRAKLSRMGLRPGVPDLVLILPGGRVAFVEFKSKKGTLTEAQEGFAGAAVKRGAMYALVRDYDTFTATIAMWTQEARTRKAA